MCCVLFCANTLYLYAEYYSVPLQFIYVFCSILCPHSVVMCCVLFAHTVYLCAVCYSVPTQCIYVLCTFLPTQCIYVPCNIPCQHSVFLCCVLFFAYHVFFGLCTIFRTSGDYFRLQHKPVLFSNVDMRVFTVRWKTIFKYNLGSLYS
jgi:hypothetical protein